MKLINRSNLVHSGYAVGFQLAAGIPLSLAFHSSIPLLVAGTLAAGFFVGVEWMQQVYMNLLRQGRRWPVAMTLHEIILGFYWVNDDGSADIDRYGDCGCPAFFCTIIFLVAEKGMVWL